MQERKDGVDAYFDQEQKIDILASWRLAAYLTIILVVNVDALERKKPQVVS